MITLSRVFTFLGAFIVLVALAEAAGWYSLDIKGQEPAFRAHTSGGVLDSKLVLFGGQTYAGSALNDLWTLDVSIDPNVWQQVSTSGAPSPRFRHSGSTVNGNFAVYGGTDDHGLCLNDGAYFSLGSSSWTPITPGPPRRAHGSAALGTDLYIFGGSDCTVATNELWRYSLPSANWTLVSGGGPTGRSYPAMAAITGGNELFVFGGNTIDVEANDLWRFDVGTRTWALCGPGILDDWPLPRWGAGAVEVDTDLFMIVSGTDGDMCFGGAGYAWVFNASCARSSGNPAVCNGDCWLQVPTGESPAARAYPVVGMATTANNTRTAVLYGGLCAGNAMYTDAWVFALRFPEAESGLMFYLVVGSLSLLGLGFLIMLGMCCCRTISRYMNRNQPQYLEGGMVSEAGLPPLRPCVVISQPQGRMVLGYRVLDTETVRSPLAPTHVVSFPLLGSSHSSAALGTSVLSSDQPFPASLRSTSAADRDAAASAEDREVGVSIPVSAGADDADERTALMSSPR